MSSVALTTMCCSNVDLRTGRDATSICGLARTVCFGVLRLCDRIRVCPVQSTRKYLIYLGVFPTTDHNLTIREDEEAIGRLSLIKNEEKLSWTECVYTSVY